ncbi:hypothetical protein RB598_002233 [Gaeumannomyces tritici]
MAETSTSLDTKAKAIGRLVAGFTTSGIFKRLGHKNDKQGQMLTALASRAIRKLPHKIEKAIIELGMDANPISIQETIQEIMVDAVKRSGLRKHEARRIMASNMERIGGIAFSFDGSFE